MLGEDRMVFFKELFKQPEAREAYQLGELGDESDLPRLEQLSKNEAWMVRFLAASAVGKIASEAGLKIIEPLLKDQYPSVRAAAANAAKKIAAARQAAQVPEITPEQEVQLLASKKVAEQLAGRKTGVASLKKITKLLRTILANYGPEPTPEQIIDAKDLLIMDFIDDVDAALSQLLRKHAPRQVAPADNPLAITDMHEGMTGVNTRELRVKQVFPPETVQFKKESALLRRAILADETGEIQARFWKDKTSALETASWIRVENARAIQREGKIMLSVGKKAAVIPLDKPTATEAPRAQAETSAQEHPAGERIGTERITREEGYLYFIAKDGFVWRAPMKNNPTGTKARVGTQKIEKKFMRMYYLDKEGFVREVKLKNAPPD